MGQHGKKRQESNTAGIGRNAARRSNPDLPFWSADGSGGRGRRQGVSPHTLLGASPLIPALIVMVGIMALVYSGWLRQGVETSGSLPVVQEVSALFQKDPPPVPGALVWARKESGFYYCRGNVLFGRGPGKLQTQSEALTSGYRPEDGHYCTSDLREAHHSGHATPAQRRHQ